MHHSFSLQILLTIALIQLQSIGFALLFETNEFYLPQTLHDQMSILESFFTSTNQNDWKLGSGCGYTQDDDLFLLDDEMQSDSVWNFSTDGFNYHNNPCDPLWDGLTCSAANDSIIAINLYNYGLKGTLPPLLGDLTTLQSLNLGHNCIGGPIPSEIGNLWGLTFLGLHINSISGKIPEELWDLTSLEVLRVNQNSLEGSLSSSVGLLTDLSHLYVFENKLSSSLPTNLGLLLRAQELKLNDNEFTSSLPSHLFNLAGLTLLTLHSNFITGGLPVEIGQLTRLQHLSLYRNYITGSVPTSIGQMQALTRAWFDFTSISGSIPSEIGLLTALQYLYFTDTLVSSTIPTTIGNMSELLELGIKATRINGTIPSELGMLRNLRILDLKENKLTGQVPETLGNISSLLRLELGSNRLIGPIPSEICMLSNLERLYLYENILVSTLPSCIGSLTALKELHLNFNRFSGTLPPQIGSLSNLESLDVSSNLLSGPIPRTAGGLVSVSHLALTLNLLESSIPEEIGLLSSLKFLDLSENLLTNTLPSSIGNLLSLKHLILYRNLLSGQVPESITKLTALQEMVMYNNRLSGSLPSSIGHLISLTGLSLFENAIGGSLPDSIGLLTSLSEMLISSNRLVGTIPFSIGSMKELTLIWLNDNSLCGHIPSTIGQLEYLRSLRLEVNQISGSIPHTIGGSSMLSNFAIFSNRITGPIPTEIGLLTDLQVLDLYDNSITSSIPSSIGGLKSLTMLWAHRNKLSGPLPVELSMATDLYDLQLFSNLLTGTLPSSFSALSQLFNLQIQNNSFSGPVTSALIWPNMKYLDLSHNLFTGTLPSSISTLTDLKQLKASNNFLRSTIPSEFGELSSSVQVLDLSRNKLEGKIPADFFELRALVVLQLSSNSLTGDLRGDALCGFRQLEIIDLSGNFLSGTIPACFSTMHQLNTLLLAKNKFTSTSEGLGFLTAPNLTTIDISSNLFQGTFPHNIFRSTKLKIFAASANCLNGLLPDSICDATALNVLVFDGLSAGAGCRGAFFSSRNVFGFNGFKTLFRMSGSLPSCIFTALTNITLLHLSGNGLTGSLPQSLSSWPVGLVDLSLSHNQLTGPIPAALQQQCHQFSNLDLSFNKINGLLSGLAVSPRANVDLRVNRFSGFLSPSVIALQSVRILESSLIDCTDQNTQLPLADPYFSRFKCGSDTFNYYMIAFSVLSALAAGMIIYSAEALWQRIIAWIHPHPQEAPIAVISDDGEYIRRVLTSLETSRHFCLVLLAGAVVFLIPTYGALSASSGTHFYNYAWTVSAGFKNGIASASTLLGLWSCFVAVVFWHFSSKYWRGSLPSSKEQQEELGERGQHSNLKGTARVLLLLRLLIVFSLNFAIMMSSNIGYVIIVSLFSNSIQTFAALFLTIHKLMWNKIALPALLKNRYLFFGIAEHERQGIIARRENFIVGLILSAFNSVIAPSISLMVANANCFSQALYAPPFITSTYQTTKCRFNMLASYSRFKTGEDISSFECNEIVANSVSYQPSFLYNFQCSATLLETYTPVFLFAALVTLFGDPVVHRLARYATTRWPSFSRSLGLIKLLPKLMHTAEERRMDLDSRKDNPDNLAAERGYRVLDMSAVSSATVQDFVILCTFGTTAPLLGIVLLASLVCRTLRLHHLIVAFAANEDEQVSGGASALVMDCKEFVLSPHPLYVVRWYLIVFASIFLSFFILDTAGDTVGWRACIWAPTLMLALPMSMCLIIDRIKFQPKMRTAQQQDLSESDTLGSIELNNVGPAGRVSEGPRLPRTSFWSSQNPLHSPEAPDAVSRINNKRILSATAQMHCMPDDDRYISRELPDSLSAIVDHVPAPLTEQKSRSLREK